MQAVRRLFAGCSQAVRRLSSTSAHLIDRSSLSLVSPNSKGFFFPWLDGFDTLIKFLSIYLL